MGSDQNDQGHEFSFDDTPGQEKIFIQSQKDFHQQVAEDEHENITRHHEKHLKKGDLNILVGGDYTLRAKTGITLAAGGSSLIMTPNKISIKGAKIAINPGTNMASTPSLADTLMAGVTEFDEEIGEQVQTFSDDVGYVATEINEKILEPLGPDDPILDAEIAEKTVADGAEEIAQVIERPAGLEAGAEHVSQVKKLEGYETKEDLVHPAGSEYTLSKKEALNFHGRPTPKTLPAGTKIYRVIEKDKNANGPWWSYELPKSKSGWRSGYAVKKIWNKNGKYVEHIISNKELPVWEGQSASQPLNEEGFPNWVQRGGKIQLYVPQSTDTIPGNLSTMMTEWE
jgi:hypothetical protein